MSDYYRKKNTATYYAEPMIDTTTPAQFVTGETVTDTAYYKDGAGAWTSLAITDTFSEIGTTGIYEIDLTAGEMNHDQIIIKMTSTNGADNLIVITTGDAEIDDLVRSTTPANTLDVNATGEAGIDLDNTSGTLAKTTDITGFNDIAATDIVSAGAITTLAGAVVNVDTVDTTTTNSDMRGTDNALLAASAPTNFGDLAITITTGEVTVGTNNDKTGYTASTVTDKIGYSISGTKTTLDALNDIAATDIVSGGAINTTTGAVDTVTTNTDMRGTDNALLAASAPTNFGDMAITLTTGLVSVGTNNDKTGYDLNADQSAVTVGTVTTNTDMRGTDSAALASVCTEGRLGELDAANLPADLDGVKAKTDNLPDGVTKNTALNNFEFLLVDSTDHVTPKTLQTVTATRSIDGAAFGACANAVAEVSSGIYKINLAASDLNGDVITFRFTAAAADDRLITIKTNA